MESKSLAVRYRPTKLSEVFGQDNSVAVMEGMFAQKKFPAAMLISGHTGCGKTTLAQIFGRRVNCEKNSGCGKCMSCQFGDRHPDIVFHNAGTDGKIEDIRKLIHSAKVAPTTRKRVIVVDECFPADTEVLMADGAYRDILDIKEGDVVFSYNTVTGALESNTVTAFYDQGERELLRVWLDDGSYQDCTPNHKWWSVTRNKMVRADELLEGEDFLPFSSVERPTD